MARILVVDDESTIRDILARRLSQWGHDVVTAHNAEAAVEEMTRAPAQIVFSDVIMPVNDGVWLARLRASWRSCATFDHARMRAAKNVCTIASAKIAVAMALNGSA